MAYDVAIYVGDSEKLQHIISAVERVFSQGGVHSGAELVDALQSIVSHRLAIPIIHVLLNEGVLSTERPSLSVGGYLFSLDQIAFASFCEEQLAACKIVEEIDSRTERRTPQRVEFVATLPPSILFDSAADIGSIDHALRRMMVSARESIWIANPFFDDFGMEAIADPLIGRLRSAVNVRLLTRGVFDQFEGSFARPLLRQFLERVYLQDGKDGLSVRDFFERDSRTGRVSYALHSKIVIVDRCHCYLGSANVTQHGLRHNFEIGVILRGNEVEPVTDLFERVWTKSTTVTLDLLK